MQARRNNARRDVRPSPRPVAATPGRAFEIAHARADSLSLFLRASIGLHVFAAGAVSTELSWWPLVLGTLAADHLVITAAGLWPTSTLLGPNLRRLPPDAAARREIALTFDDGPDPEVTPRVLDMLDEHGVKATFFCVGSLVARYPQLARDIVARGHAIENHSNVHRHHFSLLGPRGFERESGAAQDTITGVTGRAPRFFRAPAGLRNPFLQPVLARHGLALTSWSRRGFDTVWRDPQRVARRLTHGLAGGDILLLHDGHSARTVDAMPVVLDVLPRLLAAVRKAGLKPVTLAATFGDRSEDG